MKHEGLRGKRRVTTNHSEILNVSDPQERLRRVDQTLTHVPNSVH